MLVLICFGHIYQSVSQVGISGGDVNVTVILIFDGGYHFVDVIVVLNEGCAFLFCLMHCILH